MIEANLTSSTQWVLTDEGKVVANEGSHEAQVFNAVPRDGSVPQSEIMASICYFRLLGCFELNNFTLYRPYLQKKAMNRLEILTY